MSHPGLGALAISWQRRLHVASNTGPSRAGKAEFKARLDDAKAQYNCQKKGDTSLTGEVRRGTWLRAMLGWLVDLHTGRWGCRRA